MLRKFLLFLLVLTMIILATAWLFLRGSLPVYEGDLLLPGLADTVTVERDALGTVTLSAENRLDLARGLGFIHAQERFFEMDLMRRKAAGELAELFGGVALPADRKARGYRMRARAQSMLQRLPQDQLRLLEAYRDGVNTGLNSLKTKQFGYLLTQTLPRPWRSEDSLLIVLAMHITLQENSIDRELGLSMMHASLPESAYRFLTASGGEWDAALDDSQLEWPPYPPATDIDLRSINRQTLSGNSFQELPIIGSNAFAVGGALTNGSALVANDMHLSLQVPGLWFRTHLVYPDPLHAQRKIDVIGVSLPGNPVIVAGSNRHIAWGFTNSYGDFADWVRVKLDLDNPARYADHGEWKAIKVWQETLHVRDAPDEQLEIHETEWGPILARDYDGTPLALVWTAFQPDAVNLDIIELEQADSLEEAVRIAQNMGIPAQNFIAGSRNGDIAWTIAGRIPLRTGGYDANLPADWGQQTIGWRSWLAPADYPLVINPPGMRLWNGNSRMVDGALLKKLGDGGYDLGARSQQIRDQLHALNHVAPKDLLAIQLDDRALLLARWKQLLEETLQKIPSAAWSREMQQALRDWDGHASPQSVAYRVVHSFRYAVMEHILNAFAAIVKLNHPDFVRPRLSQVEHAVWKLIKYRPPHLLPPGEDSWEDMLAACAQRVTAWLQAQPGGIAARNWGEENTAAIRHPLSRALPTWIAAWLDMPADQLPGDHHMPRVQTPNFGASLRFVVAPGEEENGYFQMPGGQSGHPLSPYYGSGHSDWVAGNASPFLPGPPQQTLYLHATEVKPYQ
ncbi:penicillin amidase [Nitrosomonas eutropha]|nr:penicillin amidase [Nitrosomonas eutropha]